jgi:hypothetical protein
MVVPLTDHDKIVAIETTIRAMCVDGSRTFTSAAVARECRQAGHDITGTDVGRYFGYSEAFLPLSMGKTGLRWQVVGDRCGLSSMKVAKYPKDTGRYEKVSRFRWIPMEDEG